MTTDMFRLCNLNSTLSSFMTYHLVCNNNNTTGVTSGAGTANPFGASEVNSVLVEFV